MKRILNKLAKAASIFGLFAMLAGGISCSDESGSDSSTPEPPKTELSEEDAAVVNQFASATRPTTTPKNDSPTIYCAGDSTVKTYPDAQFIGGWGQFLQLFLDESKVTVKMRPTADEAHAHSSTKAGFTTRQAPKAIHILSAKTTEKRSERREKSRKATSSSYSSGTTTTLRQWLQKQVLTTNTPTTGSFLSENQTRTENIP